MKNLKKVVAVVLTAAIAFSMGIAGTVAYLTQKVGTKTNTFQVGKLDVYLSETTDVIYRNGESASHKVEADDAGADYSLLVPGDKIVKEVKLENKGNIDAYVKVMVTLSSKDAEGNNNYFANRLNDAIDDYYEPRIEEELKALGKTDDEIAEETAKRIQAIYDEVFLDWGFNYTKVDAFGNPLGMRLTITGEDMPEHVIHVDTIKTIDEYWLQGNSNWFKDADTVIPFDGSATGMDKYQLRLIYYIDLPTGEETTLFDGFNIPMEFNAEQLSFFEGLEIKIEADAVQKENFANAYSAFASLATGDHTMVVVPTWAELADASWYNENKTTFRLDKPEQIAGLAQLVDAGTTFEGKTIVLENDIDLTGSLFEPIGSYRKKTAFKGTFDGQDHTISGLSQNTWALDNGYYYSDLGLGFFGKVENATVKNVTFDGVEISGESGLCGTVAATAYGDCTFENITVKNANVADYQYYAGGVVGWASGKHTYSNINIDASTTIGAQWGEFNNANGGVIGGADPDGEFLMKDCTVACRIDSYNDVTSAYEWYSYRRSGMLIGDTEQRDDPDGNNVGNAIAPNLTCENVTVIYGDWANYHYCQFNNMGYPWVRVEDGVSNSAYSNPRYGHPTDAKGNTVVDENHVHADGEKHNELIVFDQLYGGYTGARECTYGTATHDGVKVVYNTTATNNEELDKNIKSGATELKLGSGTYIIPDSAQGKTLTFIGNGDTVVAVQDDGSYEGCDYSLDGSTVTFENITINTDSSTYTGYARMKGTYNNCTINGAYTLYGESEFNNCTFNVTGDTYNIWTWGAKKVKFNNCTFNTDGKSILVYNQSCDVYVNNCTFNDRTNGTGFTKSALETGVDGVGPKYNIYITDTDVNGFAENDKCVGYENVVGNKNSLTTDYLNIVVDGVDVY